MSSEGYCSAIDGKGRQIVVGYVYINETGKWYCLLARYRTDGTLDPTFGTNGIVLDSTPDAYILGVTVAMDGKILACGSVATTKGNYTRDYIIMRYNDDGTLDRTFSNDGRAFADFDSRHRNKAYDIHELSDGKILVNGVFENTGFGISQSCYK